MELPFTELDKPRWSRLNRPSELMCCRVAQGSKKDRLKKKVNAKAADNNASPRLNLAPTQDALVARMVSEEIRLDTLRWGLIPPWTKDRAIAHKLANARAETIDEKPSFKQPFKKRRCLLPVTGYYEWETRSDGKQPVYYSKRDGDLFCLAGLWESCTEPVETESPRLPGLDLGQARARPDASDRPPRRLRYMACPQHAGTGTQITAPPVRRRADAGTLRHPPNEQRQIQSSRLQHSRGFELTWK